MPVRGGGSHIQFPVQLLAPPLADPNQVNCLRLETFSAHVKRFKGCAGLAVYFAVGFVNDIDRVDTASSAWHHYRRASEAFQWDCSGAELVITAAAQVLLNTVAHQ